MYWELGFLRVFLCTIVSHYFIVKSLQLRGRRQIAEPRKYCLVLVIVFFDMCVFSICFVSHRLEFWVKIPYRLNIKHLSIFTVKFIKQMMKLNRRSLKKVGAGAAGLGD